MGFLVVLWRSRLRLRWVAVLVLGWFVLAGCDAVVCVDYVLLALFTVVVVMWFVLRSCSFLWLVV